MTETDTNKKLVKTGIKINGMSCVNCAANIEKTLSKLPGVYNAAVNFASEKASLEYSPEEIKPSSIVDAITELGFKPVTLKSVFAVGGMSCASCVSRVEKAIRSVPGVVSANVNLANKGTVEYLEDVVFVMRCKDAGTK
jgi:Cu+-exporting ATPase